MNHAELITVIKDNVELIALAIAVLDFSFSVFVFHFSFKKNPSSGLSPVII